MIMEYIQDATASSDIVSSAILVMKKFPQKTECVFQGKQKFPEKTEHNNATALLSV
jgi:hypothetical protein